MPTVESNLTGVDNSTVIEELRKEHALLEMQLNELKKNVYLTAEETAEVSRLKRLKLQKKDLIQRLSTD